MYDTMKQVNIGWAQTDITPDRPVYVIGQLYSRISSYVHDPITATCLVLENGDEQTQRRIRIAAEISRQILDGQEVVLP